MQSIAISDGIRKQLRMLDDHLINPFSIGTPVANDLAILFQRHRQGNPLAGAGNIGFGFGTLSLRHLGLARGGVLANHASFLPSPQNLPESENFQSPST